MSACYEELIDASGGFGRYQCFLICWLCLVCMVLGCQHGFMIFGGLHVNGTANSQQHFPFRSIVDEFGLYGMPDKVAIVTALQQAGMMFGSIFGGYLSDKKGRKKAFLPTFVALCIAVVMSGFCIDLTTFAIMRFVIGFFDGAAISNVIVLISETVPSKWRTTVNSISWPVGYIFGAVVATWARDWKLLTFLSLLPAPIIFIVNSQVQESPKLLIEQNRIEDAKKVFQRISTWNNQTLRFAKCDHLFMELQESKNRQTSQENVSILLLTKDRKLFQRLLVLAYGWFVTAMNYFSMLYNISNLSGNPAINLTIVMVWRGTCGILVLYADYRFRKFVRIICSKIALTSVIICYVGIIILIDSRLHEDFKGWIILFSLIGTGTTTVMFTMLTMLMVELMPTVLRNKGAGILLCVSHMGAVVAPSVFLFAKSDPVAPYFVLLPTVVVHLILLARVLPETKHRPLPDLSESAVKNPETQM